MANKLTNISEPEGNPQFLLFVNLRGLKSNQFLEDLKRIHALSELGIS